jgi:hypothetical protein
MGYLSLIAWSQFLGISNTNNYAKILQYSKSLLGTFIGKSIISLDCPFNILQKGIDDSSNVVFVFKLNLILNKI